MGMRSTDGSSSTPRLSRRSMNPSSRKSIAATVAARSWKDAAASRVWVLPAAPFGLGNSFHVDGAQGVRLTSTGEYYLIPVDIEEPCTVELTVHGC